MPTLSRPVLSDFARDILSGLSKTGQKEIHSKYFYDDLGSALFEAITFLPEYGLTRADERLLQTYASPLASAAGQVTSVFELGSGSGKKTRYILEALREQYGALIYSPIDVSAAALAVCEKETSDLADVRPVRADWIEGLGNLSQTRSSGPVLLLFLGSSIGNLERSYIPSFLDSVRATLKPGDLFLLGADLVKDVETMLAAYDDPTGVTAAFNLNILGRANRELGADFDLRAFTHEVRWNTKERRIEMHLLSGRNQTVFIAALDKTFDFEAGETIWTESSHKFSEAELLDFAGSAGFAPVHVWVDHEWRFAEALWKVEA